MLAALVLGRVSVLIAIGVGLLGGMGLKYGPMGLLFGVFVSTTLWAILVLLGWIVLC